MVVAEGTYFKASGHVVIGGPEIPPMGGFVHPPYETMPAEMHRKKTERRAFIILGCPADLGVGRAFQAKAEIRKEWQNLSIWVPESVILRSDGLAAEVTFPQKSIDRKGFGTEGHLTSVTWGSGTSSAIVTTSWSSNQTVKRRRGKYQCGNRKVSH